MKALKVTISGSYRTANKEVIDFQDVEGFIPYVDEELAIMHVQGRYAVTWIKNAVDKKGEKIYKARITHIRQVFVDNMETTDYKFSFIGKDIKDMSYEELQDLATLKDLRRIPLPKEMSGVSLREMRERAYLEYTKRILDKSYGDKDKDFNYAKAPAVIVNDMVSRKESSQKITNEEMIAQEQGNASLSPTKNTLSLDDLKGIAKQKGVMHPADIGFDALYGLLYGGGA